MCILGNQQRFGEVKYENDHRKTVTAMVTTCCTQLTVQKFTFLRKKILLLAYWPVAECPEMCPAVSSCMWKAEFALVHQPESTPLGPACRTANTGLILKHFHRGRSNVHQHGKQGKLNQCLFLLAFTTRLAMVQQKKNLTVCNFY